MAASIKDPPVRLRPEVEEIRRQLEVILGSAVFQGSKRCSQFLQYVCDKTFAGEMGALKERAIAVEVFGRTPQSDLAEDTIVRVGAREVRKRLGQYYATPQGAAAPVRIDLPSGSYQPDFRYAEPQPELHAGPAIVAPALWRKPEIVYSVCAAVLLLTAVLWTQRSHPPTTNRFEQFWAPVFETKEALLVAVGNPLVYHPSLRAQKLNLERLPQQPLPLQRPLQLKSSELDGSDMIPVANQYVGFGDMVVGMQAASMLGARGKSFRVRLAGNVAFADLRKTPTLLIGAITNRWTMELGQSWRFRFDYIPGKGYIITDTAAGPQSHKEWIVRSRTDDQPPEDYALVSRIPNSPTGGLLIVAAGIKQFGTEAAGHVVSDPFLLDTLLSRLPPGWERKNTQIVLRTNVIGNTPAQPEMVAWHVW
ncbi:MAG: hypothetical protein HYZ37_11420 [Candidatus Solibacter usitatus]|nr:hypothetical protein [Candidatus Solibacter usitatus]